MTLTPEQIAAAEAAGATEQELSYMEQLIERAAIFDRAYEHLQAIGPTVRDTELEDPWRKLMQRADDLRGRIEAARSAVADALSWVRGVFGLNGLSGARGLGIVWFVPVVAIGAIVAAIGYWLSDYYKFVRRFDEQRRLAAELEARGVDPIEANRQAAATVAGTIPGWLEPLRGPFGIIALAVGGFVVWRMLR